MALMVMAHQGQQTEVGGKKTERYPQAQAQASQYFRKYSGGPVFYFLEIFPQFLKKTPTLYILSHPQPHHFKF